MAKKNPFKVFNDTEERPVKKLEVDESLIEGDLCRDLGFILDSSGSWTSSIYMNAAYGVCDAMCFCHDDKIDRQFNVINYSNITIASGWHDSSQRDFLKDIAMNFQGGASVIDMYEVRQMTKPNTEKGLILIADGTLPHVDIFTEIMKDSWKKGNRVGLILYDYYQKDSFPGMEEFADVFETDDRNELRPLIREYAEHLVLGTDRPYL